jgi:hypothetical protein
MDRPSAVDRSSYKPEPTSLAPKHEQQSHTTSHAAHRRLHDSEFVLAFMIALACAVLDAPQKATSQSCVLNLWGIPGSQICSRKARTYWGLCFKFFYCETFAKHTILRN